MLKSLVLGAILGGSTAFIWSFISWSVLPWHEKQLRSFQNEDEVAAVIASHAPESGNYLLPTGPSQEGMNAEQKKAAEEIRMQKMQKGPLVFAAVRRAAAYLDAPANQRLELRPPRRVSRHRRTRRQRHRRSS